MTFLEPGNISCMRLKAYAVEMRDYPHSRSLESIENLAKIRGNQNGLSMAEAFQVIRKIEL